MAWTRRFADSDMVTGLSHVWAFTHCTFLEMRTKEISSIEELRSREVELYKAIPPHLPPLIRPGRGRQSAVESAGNLWTEVPLIRAPRPLLLALRSR